MPPCAVLGAFPRLLASGGWGPRVKVGADGLGHARREGLFLQVCWSAWGGSNRPAPGRNSKGVRWPPNQAKSAPAVLGETRSSSSRLLYTQTSISQAEASGGPPLSKASSFPKARIWGQEERLPSSASATRRNPQMKPPTLPNRNLIPTYLLLHVNSRHLVPVT